MASAPERSARILVIDDEESIRRALKSILSMRKYEVSLAGTGAEGISLAIETNPELVILDLALPDMDGLDVCRELRSWMGSPILILSVRGNESDKVQALDLGADDFLTKPFSAGELLARMRALLRRVESRVVQPPEIQAGELAVNLARRQVFPGGEGSFTDKDRVRDSRPPRPERRLRRDLPDACRENLGRHGKSRAPASPGPCQQPEEKDRAQPCPSPIHPHGARHRLPLHR